MDYMVLQEGIVFWDIGLRRGRGFPNWDLGGEQLEDLWGLLYMRGVGEGSICFGGMILGILVLCIRCWEFSWKSIWLVGAPTVPLTLLFLTRIT